MGGRAPLVVCAVLALATPALAAPAASPPAEGSFDPSFSSDGVVNLSSPTSAQIYAVARQSDGKLVLAGLAGDDFLVVRLKRTGSLDDSFDGDGVVTTPIGPGGASASGVAIQSDGKIVVAGTAVSAGSGDFAVARYLPGGALDPQFDGDGIKTLDFGGTSETANGVALQHDGKIVVAGTTNSGFQADGVVVRLLPDGTPDPEFDGDGVSGTAPRTVGVGDTANSVALHNGKIVTAGNIAEGSGDKLLVARYTSTGALDTSFDDDGLAILTTASGNTTFALDVAVQPDGRVVAAGTRQTSSSKSVLVARFTKLGAPDLTFSHDGKVITTAPDLEDARAVALQHDGKIVTAGADINNATSIVRFTTTGGMDTSFHGTGDVGYTTTGGALTDALLVQPDGKIVAAGFANNGSVLVLRVLGDTTAPSKAPVALHRLSRHSAHATWSATDVGSGLASYDVQRRHSPRAGGALGDWASWRSHTTTHQGTVKLPDVMKVCLRARARDHAGNVGAWSAATCMRGR